jgi:hypothetical protein
MHKLRKLRRLRLESRRGEERRELLFADPQSSLANAEAVVGELSVRTERVDLRRRNSEPRGGLFHGEHGSGPFTG